MDGITKLGLKSIILFSFINILMYSFFVQAASIPQGTQIDKNQVLNISLRDNPPTLDPHKMEDNVSSRIGFDLYEGLTTEADTGALTLGVAEQYMLDNDRKVYTFTIRKNAKFSDGSPIKASDVVFSFRRLVDPKTASTYAFLAYPIVNAEDIVNGKKLPTSLAVEALDDRKVKITLQYPVHYFPNILTLPAFSILKEANVNKYPDSFTQPGKLVSSGAYKLTAWKLGDKITAVKNPHYWAQHGVVIQKVNYIPVTDGNAEIQMYQAGQVDFTFNVPSDKVKYLKETIPDELKINPQIGIYYLDFNMRQAPFKNNLKLRQALSMAVDRQVLTKDVLGRGESPAYDLVPIGTGTADGRPIENKNRSNPFIYTQQNYEWATWNADKRIREAQRLFAESGYSDENPLKVTISYNTDINHKKITLAVASMWQKTFGKLGLKIAVENQEWKVFLRLRQQGEFQIARDGWLADYNDVSSFTNLLDSQNPQNNSGYVNQEYDRILREANLEQNGAKRIETYEKGMALALADYPVIPLYNYVSAHLVKPYVGGFTGSNVLDHVYTRSLYIREK